MPAPGQFSLLTCCCLRDDMRQSLETTPAGTGFHPIPIRPMPSPSTSRQAGPPPAPLVLVTHEFHPHRGGIAIYAAEMAKAAGELGYAVEVWAPALPPGVVEPSWPFEVRRLA